MEKFINLELYRISNEDVRGQNLDEALPAAGTSAAAAAAAVS